MRPRPIVAMLVVVAMLMSGCSFIGVRPTPHRRRVLSHRAYPAHAERSAPLACGSNALQVLDLLGLPVAGALALVAYSPVGVSDAQHVGLLSAAAGTAVLFLSSAIYGSAANSVCRRRLERDQAMPVMPVSAQPAQALPYDQCVKQRAAKQGAARAINDPGKRRTALLALPVCEPVPLQRLTPAESVPSRAINTEPVPPIPPTHAPPPPPEATQPGPTP